MAKRQPDLRKLAQRQRWMIWLILLVVVSNFLLALITDLAPQTGRVIGAGLLLLQLATYVLMVVGVVLLLTARGSHVLTIICCAILMLAPCGNLLLLILVNQSVTRTLKRAGLRVGLMGANLEEVERLLNPLLCRGCGYNLTGNVSGMCPECGRRIEQVVPLPPGDQTCTTGC